MTTPHASVLLFSSEPGRLADFYAAVLGLAPRPTSDPGFVELHAGEQVILSLHAQAGVEPEPASTEGSVASAGPADAKEPTASPAARVHVAIKPCFWVHDLDAARSTVLARGAQAEEAWEWSGRRYCDGVDLEGNVFQLVSQASADTP